MTSETFSSIPCSLSWVTCYESSQVPHDKESEVALQRDSYAKELSPAAKSEPSY